VSYDLFVDKFIHPFIIYVLVGILASYLIALLLVRFPVFNDSRSRALIYSMLFFVPLVAYVVYKLFPLGGCGEYGQPLGVVNNWICVGGNILATILTPVVLTVTVLSVTKAGVSVFASRRIIGKYGYAMPDEYPGLFSILGTLCGKAGIRKPLVIVTKDRFARAFTMGWRSPVIVVSEGLLNNLDEEELETVLAHEIGHIIRADSPLTLLTVFLRDLMFFNPLCFWIFRDFTHEKEKASDDFAVKLTGKPMAFAQALIKVWRLSPRTFFDNILLDNLMPYSNFASRAGSVENRVRRILNDEHRILNHSLFAYLAILTITVITISGLYLFC